MSELQRNPVVGIRTNRGHLATLLADPDFIRGRTDIIKVVAEPGQAVAKSQVLLILEAMKMEHEHKAAADGTVDTATAKPGDKSHSARRW